MSKRLNPIAYNDVECWRPEESVHDDLDDDLASPPLEKRPRNTPTPPRSSPGKIWTKERDDITLWLKDGSCKKMAQTMDFEDRVAFVNIFFPTRHSTNEDLKDAKAICRECPVQADCLGYSITNWEKVGIWGGQTEQERRSTKRAATLAKVTPERLLPWLRRRLAVQARARVERERQSSTTTTYDRSSVLDRARDYVEGLQPSRMPEDVMA